MYDYTTSKLPPPLLELFTPNTQIHQHNTRNRFNPHITARETNFMAKTFLHQGPKVWSELPPHTKNARTLKSFNYRFKRILLNEY